MTSKQNFSGSFVNPAGILFLFFLVLIANYFKLYQLSAFLLFICFLFALSYLWGKSALRKVEIQIEALNYSAFPGSDFPVSFTIENQKIMPLIWIEIMIRFPVNCCVLPDESFDTDKVMDAWDEDRKHEKQKREGYISRRKFTWMMWHQTLKWKSNFKTHRRGIYFFNEVAAVSGDGFGLTIQEKKYHLLNPPVFVVFPQLIPVNTEPFIRNLYHAAGGSRGYYEDVTLLKSSREYQEGDSYKRINWRMLARKDEMQINVYETILPRASFFIVDLFSYQKVEKDPSTEKELVSVFENDLEEALSVLGSLFTALTDQDMSCGLYIPDSHKEKGILIPPRKTDSQERELLTALAKIQYEGGNTFVQDAEIIGRKEGFGQMYILCRSIDSVTCTGLLESINPHFLSLVVSNAGEEQCRLENRILPISDLKKGAIK